MNHASLFSGIGGFDLAATWMGWTNVFTCEIDPWCRKVLAKHYPEAVQYADIKQTDFSIWLGRIDILTGGFPCQPYSVAGKRLGKEDERHLWPEMLRAIREIQPTYVVGENVSGLLSWNDGMVFDEVQTDLEAEGYQVQSFVLPACGVNAPHRRDRVWIIAHRSDAGVEGMQSERKDSVHGFVTIANATSKRLQKSGQARFGQLSAKNESWLDNRFKQLCAFNADTSGTRQQECDTAGFSAKQGYRAGSYITDWSNWPTQPPVCAGNYGVSTGLLRRNNIIKAAGNAVVPQVVYQIFRAIEQVNNE